MSTRAVSRSENNNVGPSVEQVALDYLKTSSGVRNMVFKSATSIFDIAGLFSSNPDYKNWAGFSKDAKNFSEMASVPGVTLELVGRITEHAEKGTTESFGNLVRKIFDFLVPVTDSMKAISNRISPLSPQTFANVGTVGSAATLFSMMFLLDDEFVKMEKAKAELKEKNLNRNDEFIDDRTDYLRKQALLAQLDYSNWMLARNTSYAALGALGIAAWLLKRAAPAWLMVGLAASGTATSIISHFNNKLYLEPAQNALKDRELSYS